MLAIGAGGIGLVWGWLVGLAIERRQRPFHTPLLLTLISLILAGSAALLLDLASSLAFAATTLIACYAHSAFLRSLARAG